jgi:hypothetical protein
MLLNMDCVNRKMFCSKGIVQSVETIPHEMEVTSSNISPPLIRTCKKKKKKKKVKKRKRHKNRFPSFSVKRY